MLFHRLHYILWVTSCFIIVQVRVFWLNWTWICLCRTAWSPYRVPGVSLWSLDWSFVDCCFWRCSQWLIFGVVIYSALTVVSVQQFWYLSSVENIFNVDYVDLCRDGRLNGQSAPALIGIILLISSISPRSHQSAPAVTVHGSWLRPLSSIIGLTYDLHYASCWYRRDYMHPGVKPTWIHCLISLIGSHRYLIDHNNTVCLGNLK